MGVKREIWTGEAIRAFTHKGEFLQEIPDQSRYVDNDVIHLVDLGAKPEVLINNTAYPIPIQESEDGDVAISLDKFQTKQTEVSDDDLESASYQVIQEKNQDHIDALEESTGDKAAHSLAPAANAAKTPIVPTTGDANESGHKMLTPKDLISLKKKMDDAGVPKKGRVLVLCAQHVADLLNTSQSFEKQYSNIGEGSVNPFLQGFKIYEHSNCPKYYLDGAAWKKRDFGAAAAEGDREASFAFHPARTFKCKGTMKGYFSEAKNNPGTQANYFNYRLRFIALPKKLDAFGALVSPDHA